VAVLLAESVAWTVNVYAPAAAGVPVICTMGQDV
jgi:hypothetical protein